MLNGSRPRMEILMEGDDLQVSLGIRHCMVDTNGRGREEHPDDAFQIWKFRLTLQITSTETENREQ
jgi:hypothetical protein